MLDSSTSNAVPRILIEDSLNPRFKSGIGRSGRAGGGERDGARGAGRGSRGRDVRRRARGMPRGINTGRKARGVGRRARSRGTPWDADTRCGAHGAGPRTRAWCKGSKVQMQGTGCEVRARDAWRGAWGRAHRRDVQGAGRLHHSLYDKCF